MAKTRRQFPKAELIATDRNGLNRFIIEEFINRGATTTAIISVTVPKLNKTHRTEVDADGRKVRNPYDGHVVKVTFFTGKTGLDTAVQKAKVSDAPVQQHKYADHWLGSNTILKHRDRDEFYLILYPATDATWYETFYVDTLTGEEIPKHELEDYFPPFSESPDYGFRQFKLDSIVYSKIGGVTKYTKEAEQYINIV